MHLEFQLEKSDKKAQESEKLAAEESAKSKAAKEVIKSLTAQVILLHSIIVLNTKLA